MPGSSAPPESPPGQPDGPALVRETAGPHRLQEDPAEERFQALVAHSQDWEYWLAPDGGFVFMSPSSQRVTGYPAQEFLEDPGLLLRIVDPRDRDMMEKHLGNLAGPPPESDIDFRIRTKGGETRWLSHVCRTVLDPRGRFLGRRAVNRDVTARKAMETALRDSKELLDGLITHSPSIISVKDLEGRYILANPRFAAALGLAPGDVTGRTSRDILPPEVLAESLAEDRQILEEHRVLTLEKSLPTSDGLRHFLATKFPLLDDLGQARGVGLIATDITARKQAEEELGNTLRTRKLILDNSPIGIVFLRDRVIQWCNQSFADLFETDPGALQGQLTRVLYPDQDSYEEFGRRHYPALIQGKRIQSEGSMRRADGSLFVCRITGQALNPQAPTEGSIWILEDITERDRAVRLVHMNETRYKALLDLSRLAADTDEDLVAQALEQAVDLTGSSIGYMHLVSEDQTTLFLHRWSGAVSTQCRAGSPAHYPLEQAGVWADCVRLAAPVLHNDYLHLDGAQGLPEGHIPLRRHMAVPVITDGRVRAVVGVGNKEEPYDELDVQQLQLLMGGMWEVMARRRAESALRDSEAKFRIISESAKDAIIMTDAHGRVEYWNPAAEAIFGYRMEEFGSRDVHEFIAPAESREAFRARQAHFSKTGEGPAIGRRMELIGLRKGGREVPIEMTLSAINLSGHWHAISIIRDISERRKVEAMREDLERIARHDLKAPLNALINLPDLVMMEGGLSQTQQDYLNLLKESGYRMLSMIDASLNLVRLEQGTYRLDAAPVDLVGLARKIGLELSQQARSREIAITVLVDGQPPVPGQAFVVQGEELLLHSLLANLVKNALEASPVRAGITVVLGGKDRAELEVRNRGVVPEDVRERFFEKYATAGKKGGTGLGTYSARLIAEAHGGGVVMETSEEAGTVVRVTLSGRPHRMP